jgi:hypothetical protein
MAPAGSRADSAMPSAVRAERLGGQQGVGAEGERVGERVAAPPSSPHGFSILPAPDIRRGWVDEAGGIRAHVPGADRRPPADRGCAPEPAHAR